MARNSLGYQLNKQPIAQSFYVDRTSGIYVTSVDLFFSQVATDLPIQIQIRPMDNGLPSSSQIIPGTIKLLSNLNNSDNVSADCTTAVNFKLVSIAESTAVTSTF